MNSDAGSRPASTWITRRLRRLGHGSAIRLLDVEHIGGSKADHGLRVFVCRLLASTRHDGRQNGDALFTLANEASKCAPGVEARNASRRGALRHDQADIVEA